MLFSENAGSHAYSMSEVSNKVTLIGKARMRRDFMQRDILSQKEPLGMLNTASDKVLVRSHTHRFSKELCKV